MSQKWELKFSTEGNPELLKSSLNLRANKFPDIMSLLPAMGITVGWTQAKFSCPLQGEWEISTWVVESLLLKDKTEPKGELPVTKSVAANKMLTLLYLKEIKSEHHLTQCLLAATQADSLHIKEHKRMTSEETFTVA